MVVAQYGMTHDIIATHDLASTQALWRYNPDVAIKVALAFCIVDQDDEGEVGLKELLAALKKWKESSNQYRLRRQRLRHQQRDAVEWLRTNAIVEKSKKGEKWRAPARERWSSDASLVAAAKCITREVFEVPLRAFSDAAKALTTADELARKIAGAVSQELAKSDTETTGIPEERLRAVIAHVGNIMASIPCDDKNDSLQTLTKVGFAFL